MDVPEIMVLAGTRPEGIKIAPLVRLLCHDPRVAARVVDTGQQPGRVAEALAPFGLRPDDILTVRRRTGRLAELAAELTAAVDGALDRHRPNAVLVHGDTTTALIGAQVAFWSRIPVVHLEAGLRSHDPGHPFPEEVNRVTVARCADLHLAPTPTARRNLLAEGIPEHQVVVTGNTVVDALHTLLRQGIARAPSWVDPQRQLAVATVHRRENWGRGVADILNALARVATTHPDLDLALVNHPNPQLAQQVQAGLGDVRNARLIPPLPYPEMIGLLHAADLVITDSGGLQEEAASLGVPVVVTRETTERPEILHHGLGELVGTCPDRIVEAATRNLTGSTGRPADSPFGDGRAAERCLQAIVRLLGLPGGDTAAATLTHPSLSGDRPRNLRYPAFMEPLDDSGCFYRFPTQMTFRE
ncbi:non-hydrolyzing UDP-N-acetylglucosamine 2-epimerase [Micromonospora sp. HUAS LYJ1]|uniref:non-hydrolyzing UDP-N-acetylglucosamine 2-epimerase n=1 Tax=Micromonospora sp. HUAS LYJ1 TaxID=3061626 RepID=UPI002673FE02|nr:UDP-N-acetylglucosamine 2-epimerase (non-hydrolyzing) [Micromonospora sp. HUAS LYJ1]WKU03371.1 UDP-N-acetylglucosamine 2-epimerase (non-hydrolyzing) [Micromonospora sp. HUAS LYJ1]